MDNALHSSRVAQCATTQPGYSIDRVSNGFVLHVRGGDTYVFTSGKALGDFITRQEAARDIERDAPDEQLDLALVEGPYSGYESLGVTAQSVVGSPLPRPTR